MDEVRQELVKVVHGDPEKRLRNRHSGCPCKFTGSGRKENLYRKQRGLFRTNGRDCRLLQHSLRQP
jgi:hypothetical protein